MQWNFSDCGCSKSSYNCYQHNGVCYEWPDKALSWFSARNWCSNRGGHLMTKSDIEHYVPGYSITKNKYYWIGLRQTDWLDYNETGKHCLK